MDKLIVNERGEAQITNDMFKSLAFRAKDVIVAVARSCHGMQSMAVQLEDDLRQLTWYVSSSPTLTYILTVCM